MSISEQNRDTLIARWKGSNSDLSIWSLIASNLVVVIWALIEKWPIFTIMWIYWTQSVSIGIFWFIRILMLKKFSTKDLEREEATTLNKIRLSIVFLFHYSFAHLAYAFFLSSKSLELRPIILAGSIFIANQFFTFFHKREWDTRQKQNLGKLLFFPYMRIIPMHITIWGAGILHEKFGIAMDGRVPLALFLLLKTVADVAMYIKQLRGFTVWPSRKLDDAGPLVQLLAGKTRARKYAQKFHEQMKGAYVKEHEYLIVKPEDFTHLNLKYYARTEKELKAKGFATLGDIEDITLSQLHPQFRTFIRWLINKDGTIKAGIYYICNKGCPKILHIVNSALSAKIVELQTEFSNGCFVVTTNTTETLSTAPRILVEYLPSDALVDDLLETHNKRVKEYAAQKPELRPVSIHSLEEAIDSANRQNMIFSAYGKTIPAVLLEINKIAEHEGFQEISVEDIVYEMRKLRDSKEDNKGYR